MIPVSLCLVLWVSNGPLQRRCRMIPILIPTAPSLSSELEHDADVAVAGQELARFIAPNIS